MRVVLLGSGVLPVPPPGWGAVERAIDGLGRALQKSGVEVDIVQQIRKGRSIDEYRFALALPKILERNHWDILHASTPVVANRLAQRRIPYIYTSHSRHWNGTQGLRQRWGFHLDKRACARSVRTIALTVPVADRMRRVHPATPAERLRVIPNGVDLDLLGPDWSVRHGYQVLGVGAVHPRKSWHLAARAIRDLPEVALTLVGPVQDPSYAKRVVELGGGPNRVTLAGEVSETELRRRYAISDILLHPSGSELLSITVLEALASALPVVGTTVLAEEVPHEVAGLLVPEGLAETPKIEGLRSALQLLLADPHKRREMADAARRLAEERYGWPAVAAATLEVYREVLTPRA